MSFFYANPGSGPSAGGIGWFDFGNISIAPGQTIIGLTGTLNNGAVITFDATNVNVSGLPLTLASSTLPTWGMASFGNAAQPLPNYGGIGGFTGMQNVAAPGNSVQALSITNLTVNDLSGNPIANYEVVVADAESTNTVPGEVTPEGLTFVTNGGVWQQLAICGPVGTVATSGLGTSTFQIDGLTNISPVAAYVMTTHAPTALTLTLTRVSNSIQGFAIGFAVNRVTLQKNIGARIFPSDQFQLNIAGSPGSVATTTGGVTGIQTQAASVFGLIGNPYTLSEAMAPGSVSALGDYAQILSVANATPGGTIPPGGTLPITFSPELGDDVIYTVLNEAPPIAVKTVDKAFADIGELLTYTVTVNNPNNVAISNVLVTDATPAGTTYAGNLIVSEPFTGTDPASGITITSIPANSNATISWQVQVNTTPPIPDPVTNIATVAIPGFPLGNTNTATTQIRTAFVIASKAVDKTFVVPGDILTYTINLSNMGNVPANNVILTDAVPLGTSFVAGSVTGATGIPPTLTLLSPIPAGGNATVTFQVLVGNTVPVPNPILNSASATFNYTVDPANPNGASGSANTNTVSTQFNAALITTTKAVDAAYGETDQILTYTLTVQNTGNVPANNVVITDNIPADTTFVAGSVTGATGIPPMLNVASIPASSTAVVTFKVKVSSTIPLTNPLVNIASTAFNYTVDPAVPNGASGTAPSNSVTTQINDANITTVKTVDKTVTDIGAVLTYTLTLTNSGNVPANNVVITDPAPAGTTFINGSLLGATGAPPTMNISTIPAGGTAVASYQVLVGNAIPVPNPVANTANVDFVFTLDPANPNGQAGTSASNTVNTQVNSAIISTVKAADLDYADVGDTITYTIIVTNSGSVTANNVVLTDALPAGVSFVAGSLINATGTPPTLTLTAPIPAGGSVTVSYKVLVGAVVPTPNPVENSVKAAFTYTVQSAQPNGASGISYSDVVETQINTAKLVMTKSVNKAVAYLDDIITYQIAVTNTGNVPANNVVITDLIATGLVYVPGSLVVSVPSTGDPTTVILLTNPVMPGQTVTISFKVLVTAIPTPNPIVNVADAAFTYTVDPAQPDATNATAKTNAVTTVVFRNNYGQQINDLIESVALEQAALAAIANAEGAKIQRMAAMPGVTPAQLLCLNKSVADMMDSITLLETVLKQKMGVVSCQIDGETC